MTNIAATPRTGKHESLDQADAKMARASASPARAGGNVTGAARASAAGTRRGAGSGGSAGP